MQNKYTQGIGKDGKGLVTDQGQVIYHLQNGKRGRPKMFIKQGGKYKAWKRPIVAKKSVKQEKVEAPAATEPVTA